MLTSKCTLRSPASLSTRLAVTRTVYPARTMTAPIGQQAQHAWLASLFDITG